MTRLCIPRQRSFPSHLEAHCSRYRCSPGSVAAAADTRCCRLVGRIADTVPAAAGAEHCCCTAADCWVEERSSAAAAAWSREREEKREIGQFCDVTTGERTMGAAICFTRSRHRYCCCCTAAAAAAVRRLPVDCSPGQTKESEQVTVRCPVSYLVP